MTSPEEAFSHFVNTRPQHERWTIIGVAGAADDPGVRSVEIFQGPDRDEPRLVLAPEDVPQFVAGLIATVLPGDLTAAADS
ncbi:hypothetical protein N8J89_23850 [Crossiella sp. CA-258035]|uniref:hypothetical protein n=1 Tax=Crossiella sp. CA-258035 TaxID=2981138 RepID=UPI0024BC532F|nr:hypothetical protein [Crossiella sp. CA-258035]WHT16164.1 hypothetical protein N8J89_23850 [Crossiella sp. CA-258035]